MDFDLPEDLRLLQETVRRFVDKELIPLEGQSLDGAELKPEIEQHLIRALQGHRSLAGRRSGGVRRPGPGPARALDHLVRTRTQCRPAAARRPHPRAGGSAPSLRARRRDARALSAAGRCAARSIAASPRRSPTPAPIPAHADHRRSSGRSLCHQWRQKVHHRRRQGRLHDSDGGDRPHQRLARRHLLLHRRYGHAGREARRAVRDPHRRAALGDRPRQRLAFQPPISSAKRVAALRSARNGWGPDV